MRKVISHYFNLTVFLSCLFLVVGCGLKPAGSDEAVTPTNPYSSSVVLYVFSAPWCAECNRELPNLKQKYLTELTAEQQQRVTVSIYVVTGKTAGQVATQEAADEYGKSLELPFTMIADKYYKTYRQYFEEGNAIPAAVLMDSSKQILKAYEAGTTDLEDIFVRIKTNLK